MAVIRIANIAATISNTFFFIRSKYFTVISAPISSYLIRIPIRNS